MNIASGSCRELFELFPRIKNGAIRITCVDYDPASIDFSKKRLTPFSRHAEAVFINDNVLRIAARKNNIGTYGLHDLIYSVGLYDYLPDKVLKRLLTAQMTLLKPGGRMILAFKDAEAYDETDYDWFLDWQFVQRTEPEVLDLVDNLGMGVDTVTTTRDQSGIILFCVITRR